ncbi:hypothetical protein [Kordia sp.]|uniref:hypothetical protein n=1 Tax=Kordia sp. TaxID=1965332 RepID=UPI003D6AC0AC
MKLKLSMLSLLVILISCTDAKVNEKISDVLTLGSFVDLDKLNAVKMSNNSGTFTLTNTQLQKFKVALSTMKYDPTIAVKVGSIAIELEIDGKKHNISSGTHKNHIEAHKSIATKNIHLLKSSDWLYFETGGINFNNYKREN